MNVPKTDSPPAVSDHGSMLSVFAASANALVEGKSQSASARFGNYTLTRSIGRGGFGEVFLAVHETSWDMVAIKVLSKRRRANAAALSRFELEIRVGKQLRHPHILPVIDDGEINGVRYFVTPFIEGEDLLHRLAKKPMPVPDAVRTVQQVAEAVSAAHAQGYLHRDIKPANILIDAKTGNPFVADFGLAKVVAASTPNTETLAVLGTQPYMPPEQADPNLGEFSEATDTYALGVTLYQALTGRTPFPRVDKPNRDILLQIAWDRPQPPSTFNTQVPPDLDRICLICLQKSPFDRYESAAELAADLGRFEEGRPIRGKLPGMGKRFYRNCRRHPRMTIALATSVCLAIAGGVLARFYATEASTTAEQLVGAEKGKNAAIGKRKFQEYVADMKEAASLWAAGDAEKLGQILARHEAHPNRGFEWHYWDRLARSASLPMDVPFRGDSLALSADGKVLAVASSDRVAAYNVPTRQQIAVWPMNTKVDPPLHILAGLPWRQSVALSSDGQWVGAVTSAESGATLLGTLRVWSTITKAEAFSVINNERFNGLTIAFSGDDQNVVAGSTWNRWASWRVPTGESGPDGVASVQRVLVEQTNLNQSVTDLRINGSSVATTTWEGTSFTSNLDGTRSRGAAPLQFRTLGSYRVMSGGPSDYSLSLDRGSMVLRGREGPFGGRPGKDVISNQLPGKADTRCFAIDGTRVASGDADRIVRLWAVNPAEVTASIEREYRGATDTITAVAIRKSSVACVDHSGTIRVWPLFSSSDKWVQFPERTDDASESVASKVTSPTGKLSVTQSSPGSPVQIERVGVGIITEFPSDGQKLSVVTFDHAESNLAFTLHRPPNRKNYKKPPVGRIVVWDVAANRQRLSFDLAGRFFSTTVSFSADGRYVAIANSDKGVQLFDRDDTTGVTLFPDRRYYFAKLSPSGRFLVAGSPGSTRPNADNTKLSVVWDILNKQPVCEMDEFIQAAAFDADRPDDRLLVVGQVPHLIDLNARTERPTLLRDLPKNGLTFSRDGRRLFAVEHDRLRIFTVDSDDGTLLLDAPCKGGPADPSRIEEILDGLMNPPTNSSAPTG